SRKSQSCARRLPNSLIKSISTQGHPPEIGVLHGSGSHAAPVHLRDERTITKTNAAQEIDARGDGCRCCGSWLVFEISRARAPGGLGFPCLARWLPDGGHFLLGGSLVALFRNPWTGAGSTGG